MPCTSQFLNLSGSTLNLATLPTGALTLVKHIIVSMNDQGRMDGLSDTTRQCLTINQSCLYLTVTGSSPAPSFARKLQATASAEAIAQVMMGEDSLKRTQCCWSIQGTLMVCRCLCILSETVHISDRRPSPLETAMLQRQQSALQLLL